MSDQRWDGTADTMAEDAAMGGDAEIEEKVAVIEETREDLASTVDAIEERLSPSNVIADAKQTVRDATVGRVEEKVNDVTQTANRFLEDPARTAQETGSGIIDSIRENPVPAALIGVGVGWMLLKRNDGAGKARSYEFRDVHYDRDPGSWTRDPRSYGRGSSMGDVGDKVSDVGDRIGQLAGGAADGVGQAAGQVASTVGSTASQVGQTVGEVPAQAQTMARSLGDQASQAVRSNPIGASLAALAVGTMVGMLLPSTPAERRVIGPTSERLIEQAGETATQQLRAVRSEVEQQG
jgi:ElaB/YqjD/DUF883 family membrane-anchored ribosome-binding protein